LRQGRRAAEGAAGELRARHDEAVRGLDAGLRVALVVLEDHAEGDGLVTHLEAAGVVDDLGGELGADLGLGALLGGAAGEGQAEADGDDRLSRGYAQQRRGEERRERATQACPTW